MKMIRKNLVVWQCSVFGAAVLAMSLVAQAQINSVSKPAGFYRVTVPGNSKVLVALPFEPITNTIGGILGAQLTGGSNEATADRITTWDAAGQAYSNAYKAAGTAGTNYNGKWFSEMAGWTPSPMSLSPGEGFWIESRHATTQTVFIAGRLPLGSSYGRNLLYGMNLAGFPFGTRTALDSLGLPEAGAYAAGTPDLADNIIFWNGTAYSDTRFLNDGSWSNQTVDGAWCVMQNEAPVAMADTLRIGEGFWYLHRRTNVMAWTESRPYVNVFPANNLPPAIDALVPNTAGSQLTLTIRTLGATNEKVEVYYQNLAATGTVAITNWAIAATNLSATGVKTTWIDTGTGGRGAVSTVYARYYLAGRGDIDSDGDGLPDSRENFVVGTDSSNADTDGDGTRDGAEVNGGTNPKNPASFLAWINGTTTYSGLQMGVVKVLAASSSTAWTSSYLTTLPSLGSFSISNVPTTKLYYLKAFRDVNGNGTRQTWEPSGNAIGSPFQLMNNANGFSITLTDPLTDSDADGLPDWWEMYYFQSLTQNGTNDPDVDLAKNLKEYRQGRDPRAQFVPDTNGLVRLHVLSPLD